METEVSFPSPKTQHHGFPLEGMTQWIRLDAVSDLLPTSTDQADAQ